MKFLKFSLILALPLFIANTCVEENHPLENQSDTELYSASSDSYYSKKGYIKKHNDNDD